MRGLLILLGWCVILVGCSESDRRQPSKPRATYETIPKDLLELRCTTDDKTEVERSLHFKNMRVGVFEDGEICTIKKVSLKYE